jgi:Cyclin
MHQEHQDLVKAPPHINADTSKTSLRRGRVPVLYSAIGSLEDPKNLGLSWRNDGVSSQTMNKRDFPSVVNTASAASGSSRRSKPNASTMSRRSSFGGEKDSLAPGDNDADQTPAMANTRKHAKKVSVSDSAKPKRSKRKEMFRPSSDAYTPRIDNHKKGIKYKPAETRTPVMAGSMGTLHRPNYSDALRRVAMIIRQHVVKIETRFEDESSQRRGHKSTDKLFSKSMEDLFVEEKFMIPRYRCTMVRVPMAITGMACGFKKIKETYSVPTEAEIYEFAHRLFKTVQLSSECSIVSLIYVERLMETSKVPLLASTWRPIFMSGLLMASKVWQDLSTWNVEFSNVYPQYSLENINKLELQFLRMIKWDLYISSSLYAKYYFALRSLEGKHDFRLRYNHMVGGDSVRPQQARQIEERSLQVKEEALLQLSRSM